MPYVVCEPCHDCKYTDCVAVCPCDCFYHDDVMLYIDPDQCIDCDACRPECPVEAIFQDCDRAYFLGVVYRVESRTCCGVTQWRTHPAEGRAKTWSWM